MIIGIGNDHAAVALKCEIIEHLKSKGHTVIDFGCNENEKCDYADKGAKVAKAVISKKVDQAILICGTGIGISIAANKVHGIRAAVVSDCASARLTKQHNNANILAFGSRIVGSELAKDLVDAWLDAEFEGGRHQGRIEKIHSVETTNE